MVLAVVQLHDLCVDVGLQGTIVVGQVRERVLLPRCSYLVQSLAQAGCTPEAKRGRERFTNQNTLLEIQFSTG